MHSRRFSPLAVGVSADPAHVTMIDSIKVYTKTKEQFGWPDDDDIDQPGKQQSSTTSAESYSNSRDVCIAVSQAAAAPMTSLDR